MAKTTIVWSRSEAANVADIIESGGGEVTRVQKLSDFPPRWEITYVDKKNGELAESGKALALNPSER